jgi:hypothetical protein
VRRLLARVEELEDGGVKAIPRDLYNELTGEFKSSGRAMKAYKRGTDYWRALVLTARPAWMVNNLLGNVMLLAVAHPVQGAKAFAKGRGELGKIVSTPELGFGFSETNVAQLLDESRGIGKLNRKVGDINTKLADEPFRTGAMVANVEPSAKLLAASRGSDDINAAATELMANPEFRNVMLDRSLNQMIDFTSSNTGFDNLARTAMPFYGWMSGMTKRGGRLVADEPWKAAAIGAIGKEGARQNEATFGALPSYLKGVINLGKREDGTQRVMTTMGVNPFATPYDVARLMQGTASEGGENLGGQLNPFIRAGVEALTGENMFYKYPIEGGLVERYARSLSGNLPQWNTGRKIAQDQGWVDVDKSKTLYAPSTQDALLSYLGLPIRGLNIPVANARAKEEQVKRGMVQKYG